MQTLQLLFVVLTFLFLYDFFCVCHAKARVISLEKPKKKVYSQKITLRCIFFKVYGREKPGTTKALTNNSRQMLCSV